MLNENGLNPAEMELEAALGGLQPVAVVIERDRLMYRAGQSSARRRNLAWPILSIALALMLGVSLLHQPERQTQVQTVEVEKLVYITQPASPTQSIIRFATQGSQPDPYQLQVQARRVRETWQAGEAARLRVLAGQLAALAEGAGRSAIIRSAAELEAVLLAEEAEASAMCEKIEALIEQCKQAADTD